GISGGWHAAVRAVGVRPWWLKQPAWLEPLAIGQVTLRPSLRRIASALLILARLVAAAAIGVGRRGLDMAGVAILALLLDTALVYQLRRDGYRPVGDAPGAFSLADKLGASYSAVRHRPDATVYLEQVGRPPRRAGSRVLERVSLTPGPGLDPPYGLVLSVAP